MGSIGRRRLGSLGLTTMRRELHVADRSMYVRHMMDPDIEGWDQGHEPSRSSADVVAMVNAVFAGLATVFTATRSIVIVGLGVGLAGMLGLVLVLRHLHPR